ncbi:MAG: ferritin family protein [Deltaproteobacteria bacterium]|nr:ferritin family protein [Candidatus Anaeroferrophillus wilburensis]MBN2888625.1 ferritin family protein [Deltaproteobacteria bacterium]
MEEKRLNALEIALNNEMTEREFYLKHAERTTNPVGKAMFKQIADEELEHYERLKQLQEKWQRQEQWPATVPLTVANSNLSNTLKGVLEQVDTMQPGDDDDLEAVRKAIAFEAEGVMFYEKLRDASDDKKEKAFFALLASIEAEHLASLKDTEAYFIDPAQWFQQMEHGGLDGA